ncbi:MAG TPA: OmpA family protein, partial [Rhodobacteraceae bacterium]|nr:OmpA family protein [Paracoccaceae bacterium]
ATTEGGMALVTELPGDAVAANTDGALIPEEMVIDLTIFFEFDSALLKSESKSQVDALCSAIQANEAALMAGTEESAEIEHGSYQIIGHTDASGSVNYNLSLSQARADEVVRYMVRECGIDGNVLQAVGMGEGRLKDAGNPRADQNRRVEIQVVL